MPRLTFFRSFVSILAFLPLISGCGDDKPNVGDQTVTALSQDQADFIAQMVGGMAFATIPNTTAKITTKAMSGYFQKLQGVFAENFSGSFQCTNGGSIGFESGINVLEDSSSRFSFEMEVETNLNSCSEPDNNGSVFTIDGLWRIFSDANLNFNEVTGDLNGKISLTSSGDFTISGASLQNTNCDLALALSIFFGGNVNTELIVSGTWSGTICGVAQSGVLN